MKKTLTDINGDIDKFNESLTTGGTVMDGYNKVTNSWAVDLDKLKQNLNNVKLSLTEMIAIQAQPYMQALNSAFEKSGEMSAGGQAAINGFSNVLTGFALMSVINLNKVKGAFVSLGASMSKVMLNPYMMAVVAGLALGSSLVKYASAQADEAEAMAEKAMNNAKAWEEVNKKTKETKQRLYDLKSSMGSVGADKLAGQVRDLSDAFQESITSALDFKEVTKAFSDNKVLISLGFDEKSFDKETDRIIERTKFFNKTVEELRNRDFQKTNINYLKEKYSGNSVYDTVVKKYANQDLSNPTVGKKVNSDIALIDIEMKKLNDLTDAILKNKKAQISTIGAGNPEYEKFKGLSVVDKSKMIKEKNWTAIDLDGMESKYQRYQKLSKKFIDEDTRLKQEMGLLQKLDEKKNVVNKINPLSILKSFGIDAYNDVSLKMQQDIEALTKNEADRLEQRKLHIDGIISSLELAGEKIEKIKLQQAETFMKKSNFQSLTDFKAGLDKVGLGSYKTLIKDFGNVINGFASESAKMDFMANGFLSLAGAIKEYNKQIKDVKEQIKPDEFSYLRDKSGQEYIKKDANLKPILDKNGKVIKMTIKETYAFLNKMDGGFTGDIASKHMVDFFDEYSISQLKAVHESRKTVKALEEVRDLTTKTASAQPLSRELLEGYNNGLDVETEKLKKVNASKLKGYEIDLKIAELQHTTFQASQKTKIETKKEDILKEFPDYVSGNAVSLTKGLGALGSALGYSKVDLTSYESIGKVIADIGDKKLKLNTSEAKFYTFLREYYIAMSDARKDDIVYTEAKMNYENQLLSYQEEIFTSYMDYIGKSQTEIEIMNQKKTLLESQAESQTNSLEKLSTMIEVYKLGADIKDKEYEQQQKLANIALQRLKYENELASYSADDLKYLKNKYDIEQNILKGEQKSIQDKITNFTAKSLSKEGVKDIKNMLKSSFDKYQGIATELKGKSSLTDEESIQKTDAEQKMLDIQSKINAMSKLDLTTKKGKEEFLKNSVEYQQLLLDLDEKNNKIKESNLNYDKDSLKIQSDLNDLVGQRKIAMSEQEYQKSRNLYKEVLGGSNYNDTALERQKEINKAVGEQEQAQKDLNKTRFEILSKISDEEFENLSKSGKVSEFLQNNVEYKKAELTLQEKSNMVLATTNEQEKQRIQYLKEQVDTMLDMVDALSKGEGIKFDASSAIKGASGAFTKLYANSQEKDASKKQKLTGKDYADMAMAGVGLATNIIGQAYDSQMNVINAELSNLELRKQLARTEEEKQQIDLEILEKQKQQIDLEYQKSTQTMGVTGVAGSALGGALSGAAMGTAIMPGIGTAIGAGMGLLGGIMGGNSAKKQAEQQKKQLEAQYRANEYLAKMADLQSATNQLMENLYSATSKGFAQAMKEAFSEFKNTQTEKGLFNFNKDNMSVIANSIGSYSEGLKAKEIFNLKTDTNPNSNFYWCGEGQIRKELTNLLNTTMSDFQTSLNKLDSNSSVESIQSISKEIDTFSKKIKEAQPMMEVNADEILVSQLENWKAYLKSLELMATKKDVFYSAYFGFKPEYIKDKAGFITNVLQGEGEKRTDFLDTFVNNAVSGSEKISKSISELVINGFSNAFIRNNTQLNDMLDDFEKDINSFSNTLLPNKNGGTTNEGYNFTNASSEIKNLITDSNELNAYQEQLNAKVQEFANYWVQAGGSLSDVIDMMPDFTKTLQSAMQNAFSETDYEDRFNSIGSALKSTIETKLNEVSFNKLKDQFLATNTSLSALMSGDLTMNNMAQLSQGIAKYTAQAEQSAYKTKAMLDMLQLDQTVDYGVSNTQVEYKTGSTNTNVYNFNNTITTTIGNLLGDARAMQNFTDSIVGYMAESMRKQNIIK